MICVLNSYEFSLTYVLCCTDTFLFCVELNFGVCRCVHVRLSMSMQHGICNITSVLLFNDTLYYTGYFLMKIIFR